MKVTRAAAIPLITHDPYLSIWSAADALNAADTTHWCGACQRLRGWLEIDGVPHCFMGADSTCPTLPQTGLDVTATRTAYTFENDKAILTVTFTSPLLLEDAALAARPVSYIDLQLTPKTAASFAARIEVSADLVRSDKGRVIGGAYKAPTFAYAQMTKAGQRPLGDSGDHTTIDWGTVYLASTDSAASLTFAAADECIWGRSGFDAAGKAAFALAFDDIASIHYFGDFRKGYWTTRWANIFDAMAAAFADKADTLARCAALDQKLDAAARALGGEDYAFICTFAYRHTVAAHKLIADEQGNLIMLSKENDSNGCIGTVDVTYPSTPLFFLADTEYVKALLRPVFRFAHCPVWEFDFAPHDVGRYPYADGQVYGLYASNYLPDREIYPAYYQYPAGCDVYDHRYQMPVEECGNMLALTAAVCIAEGKADFAAPELELLRTWCGYLETYGADPGEQLCTDDFAGHLAHNVNLSAKAIVGIEGFSRILALTGDAEGAAAYHAKAADMAASWQTRAAAGDHYALAFDRPDTWSLKYNLIWDKLFDAKLFSEEVYEKELACYVAKSNKYGVPLDSRADYTKSDWILWCAAMAGDDATRSALIAPVAAALRESETRVAFSDWYNTKTGRYVHFIARSVQGGIYMPLLVQKGL